MQGTVVSVTGSGSTGLSVTVVAGATPQDNKKLIAEFQKAASSVEEGSAPKSWIESLLERASSLGNSAVNAAVCAAASKLVSSALE